MTRDEIVSELRRRGVSDQQIQQAMSKRPTPTSATAGPGAREDRGNKLERDAALPGADGKPQSTGAITSEVPDTFGARMKRGAQRLDQALDVPARLVNRAVNSATMGAYGGVTDLASRGSRALGGPQVGTSREQDAELQEQHPHLANTASAIGYVSPVGPAAGLGRMAGKGVDALTSALVRRGAGALERGAVAVGRGAATGSLTAGGAHAVESVMKGEMPTDTLSHMGTGAVVGAGLTAAARTAQAGEAAMRRGNPDLQVLHEHGLEPSPIPGRPVVRSDQPNLSQLPGVTEPPLGVSRATPATRASAARDAAEAIVPDLHARATANNERFGEMRAEAWAAEGHIPSNVDVIYRRAQELFAANSNPGVAKPQKVSFTPPSSEREVITNGVSRQRPVHRAPPIRPSQQAPDRRPANALGREAKALIDRIEGLSQQTAEGRVMRSADLDRLRDELDDMGHRASDVGAGGVKAGDVPFRQLSDAARAQLHAVAPKIAEVNAQQHQVLTGFEARNEMLGKKTTMREPTEPALAGSAERIAQRGEETKTSGKRTSSARGHSVDRLIEMGPPDMLPGATPPPGQPPNYRQLLDQPRLQLAQENLQFTPGKVFSGAGAGGGTSVYTRIPIALGVRATYPTMRSVGRLDASKHTLSADLLTRAVRQRGEKKRKRTEGAESSP